MHLEVDNSTHAATSCPATAGLRDRALTRLAEFHYEIGLQDSQWLRTSQKTRHNLP